MSLDNFTFVEKQGSLPGVIFLCHGTGGDEHDLFSLFPLENVPTLVGIRGNITEHGMFRFFERKAPGLFDRQSIEIESEKLAAFIAAYMSEHAFEANQARCVGYSNGANIILATVFKHPKLIQQAGFLHPMLPYQPEDGLELNLLKALVTSGTEDRMVPVEETMKVVSTLKQSSAQVTHWTHQGGHEIIPTEVEVLHQFLDLA